MTQQNVPAGWYPDGSGRRRWWDGAQWTEHFEPPPAPPAPPPAPPAAPAPAAASQAVQPTPAAPRTGADTLAIAAYIACALVLVGSIGPWTTVFSISVAGTEGDGVITLVCAVIAAGTVLLTVTGGTKPRFGAPFITFLGLVVAAIAMIDIADIGSVDAASPAWGIWLVLIAGCALTVAGVLLVLRARRYPMASSSA